MLTWLSLGLVRTHMRDLRVVPAMNNISANGGSLALMVSAVMMMGHVARRPQTDPQGVHVSKMNAMN